MGQQNSQGPFETVSLILLHERCFHGTREDQKAGGDAEAAAREGRGGSPLKNAVCLL